MGEDLTICLIAPEFIPLWGGAGSYTLQLVENLPKEMEIHVVTLKREPTNKDRVGVENKSSQMFDENVHIHFISSASDTFFYNVRFQLACLRKIPKLYKKYHFDLIHSDSHMPDVFLKLLHTLRIPTVSTVHNMFRWMRASIRKERMDFRDLDRSEKAILVLYPLLKRYESFYLRNVQSLIAPSKICEEELVEFLQIPRRKIHVIYNGVNPEVFSPNKCHNHNMLPTNLQLDSRPVVLFTGRLITQKGLNTLTTAIPRVVRHLPDVCFMFVGAGDFSPYYRWLKKYGVSDNNLLNLGYINYLDMPKIYSLAAIFVLPSSHENCSISILEAMSCERAVVAANVGGNPEIIEPYYNGMLFASQDSKELAEIIIQLIEDSSLRKKLGAQARRTVIERFSAQKMVAETVKVYEKIVNSCG